MIFTFDFMRPDFDLQFLQFCENEDLRILCDILMYDNNGYNSCCNTSCIYACQVYG